MHEPKQTSSTSVRMYNKTCYLILVNEMENFISLNLSKKKKT